MDNKVGMKPNGADYDGITTQRNIKKKKNKKQNKAAALGACGMVGLTLWLMQQLSSRGKIRGKVARLQAAIHSRLLQTFVSQTFNLLPWYQTHSPWLLLLFYKGLITTFLLDLCHHLKHFNLNMIWKKKWYN